VQRVYSEVGKKFKIKFAVILLFKLLAITSESDVTSNYNLLEKQRHVKFGIQV